MPGSLRMCARRCVSRLAENTVKSVSNLAIPISLNDNKRKILILHGGADLCRNRPAAEKSSPEADRSCVRSRTENTDELLF